ncbi:41715_t:CDS:2 [Gigaspora margarita]|uniref:41715_t:CDS:1 n=1 Tax=Gigaspora margarita TaxID=4874 RepID=A0ABN7WB88_GIGMA|nr:41715_t:CDS:2 [Gigaspora margarita]
MEQFTCQFTYTPIQYINYVPPPLQEENKIISQTQPKILNNLEVTEGDLDSDEIIPSSKFWKDAETKALLFFLAKNFDMYRKNKTKFYATAAIELSGNRTSVQVDSKIQTLRSRYEKESKEETGKARSKWPYLDEMNKLFGNRENVKPDYLVSSIDDDKHVESDVENQVISKGKKRKVSELDRMYLNELKSLREAKKVSLDIAKEHLKWEKEKSQELLEWEKKKLKKNKSSN